MNNNFSKWGGQRVDSVEVMREMNNFSGVLLKGGDGSTDKSLCSFQARRLTWAQENLVRLRGGWDFHSIWFGVSRGWNSVILVFVRFDDSTIQSCLGFHSIRKKIVGI